MIKKFKPYFFNLVLIWLAVLLYKLLPYYSSFLRQESQAAILYLALTYTILAFCYYLFLPLTKVKESKGMIIFTAIKKFLKELYYWLKYLPTKIKSPFPRLTKKEKVSLLFIIVKIFFLPIMLNFFFNNLAIFKNQLPNLANPFSLLSTSGFNFILFPFLLTLIFLIDTLWFSFGYAFEAGFLKNNIKSVEPTLLGWGAALACYPPFNIMLTKYLGWFANDYSLFSSEILTFIIRIIIILLLLIYVGATLALGTKCSNLTNRGIVSRGPYSIIRHPAYISKNLAWWLTLFPIMTIPAFLSMLAWSFIYHIRTLTEEKHLKQDPDYIAYCRKVKYRYIPRIY